MGTWEPEMVTVTPLAEVASTSVQQLLLQLLHLHAHLGASGASVYDPGAQS